MNALQPRSTFRRIQQELQARQDPDFAEGQRRFFRSEVETYGVRTAQLNALIRDVAREIKPWPVAARDELMLLLWQYGRLESTALACHVYRRFGKACGEREFEMFEHWLDRYVTNWAACDGLSTWLFGACIGNCPELRHGLLEWTQSENRWKRRAAAVSLLHSGKKGLHLDEIFAVSEALLPDRDDMVEKGVGWLLKETYPAKPKETMAFLLRARAAASRTTLRYAAEKMSAADRRRLLEK